MRLGLEIVVARAAGRLSQLAGRGGGTTLPGKILATIDPGALGSLAGRLPLGSALVSATNGKTTTAGMVAEILGTKVRSGAQPGGCEPRLRRHVGAPGASGRRAGALRGRRGRFPRDRAARRAAGGAAGQPLPRPARPLRRARADRRALAREREGAAGGRLGRGERGRPARGRHRPRAPERVPLRARRPARRARAPPPRCGLEVLQRVREPVRLRGGVCRASRRVVVPDLRAGAAGSRRRRARDRARGAGARLLRPRDAAGNAADRPRPARALQRLQRGRGGVALARPGRDARRGRRGHRALPPRLRPLRAHPGPATGRCCFCS